MSPAANPEAIVREDIDRLLRAAGWHVCDMAEAKAQATGGVGLREFPLDAAFGFGDCSLYDGGKSEIFIETRKKRAIVTSVVMQCVRAVKKQCIGSLRDAAR